MFTSNPAKILIVDDNPSIHEDFQLILQKKEANISLQQTKSILFGKPSEPTELSLKPVTLQIDSAYQGQEAAEMVQKALDIDKPYALAFVDIRMPPGWDGIETVAKLWDIDPKLQIVLCSAYSDYTWEGIAEKLTKPDQFLILKKPFEVIEIRQMSYSLLEKWKLSRESELFIQTLENLTQDLKKSNTLLNSTLESIPDAIATFDLEGNIVVKNQLFLNLWNLSEQPNLFSESQLVLQHMAKQLKEGDLFIKMLSNSIKYQQITTNLEWILNSGRVISISMCPQCIDEKVIGLVFCFKDITESKLMLQQFASFTRGS